MTEIAGITGTRLRVARQARGFSQQQLAGMAGVSRQAVSAVEAGHSDPSLRVAFALAQALGMTVEGLFGPGDLAQPVPAVPVAPANEASSPDAPDGPGGPGGPGGRVLLAPVGERFVALPLRGDAAAGMGFLAAGGIRVPAAAGPGAGAVATAGTVAVRPIDPPRPTLVVAGCDPALPLLAAPLGLLDPPVSFAWWPCGSQEALRLAAAGLVHAAGVHLRDAQGGYNGTAATGLPGGADVVGFTAWREGLAVRPELAGAVTGVESLVKQQMTVVNREAGAEARRLLDRELDRLCVDPAEVPGYGTRAAGHLQVASAVAARLADAGVASEPAARAYGLGFVPLADERFDLVLPGAHLGSREVQGLLKVLTSPLLLAQLASLPGYDISACGDRVR
ncbi:MAG TPA: substrate-binding domain-containing protein [Trebonia sp.]|nr:substrate-binding domain-containing protein [Trebonia sp.]